MAKRQDINRQLQMQSVTPVRPQRQSHSFRSSLILVPLSLLTAAWILNRIDPAITWGDIMYILGIQNRERASMLIVLALTLMAILAIRWVLRGNKKT